MSLYGTKSSKILSILTISTVGIGVASPMIALANDQAPATQQSVKGALPTSKITTLGQEQSQGVAATKAQADGTTLVNNQPSVAQWGLETPSGSAAGWTTNGKGGGYLSGGSEIDTNWKISTVQAGDLQPTFNMNRPFDFREYFDQTKNSVDSNSLKIFQAAPKDQDVGADANAAVASGTMPKYKTSSFFTLQSVEVTWTVNGVSGSQTINASTQPNAAWITDYYGGDNNFGTRLFINPKATNIPFSNKDTNSKQGYQLHAGDSVKFAIKYSENKTISASAFQDAWSWPTQQSPKPVKVQYKSKTTGTDIAAPQWVNTPNNAIWDNWEVTGPDTLHGYKYDSTNVSDDSGSSVNSENKTIDGQITDQGQTITYYYDDTPVQNGNVTTKYVDEATGDEIQPSSPQTGRVGDSYTTSALSINNYALDTAKLPANASGKFTAADQTVTYYYKKVTSQPVQNSNVVTKYVDEATGKEIQPSSSQPGRVGDPYTTSPLDISDYALDTTKLPTNANGKFTDADQTVTYYYKKVTSQPIQDGTITVHYIDEDTNQDVAPAESYTGRTNDPYTTSPQGVANYALDLDKFPANANGSYTNGHQDITYYYKKSQAQPIKNGTVAVRYVDEDTNQTVAPDENHTGRTGDPYTTSPQNVDGYALDEQKLPSNANGKFTDGNQTITYYYKKVESQPISNGNVVTHFVDEATGKEIATAIPQSGRVGDSYATSGIGIDGYALDEQKLPSNASGKYTKDDQSVTYYYKQVSAGTTPGNPNTPGNGQQTPPTTPGQGGSTTTPGNAGSQNGNNNSGNPTINWPTNAVSSTKGSQTNKANQSKASSLPQTGETSEHVAQAALASVFGVLMLVGGWLGFRKRRQ
ncbi:MucBP domain-containing protein [Furfurilactobacillus entadae]|uniref:MucBP domain-containing protein n=1 Tax=Furfurilactobacillus entadae TaxID=2922307 RepID=UPI0035EA24A6